MDEKPKWVFQCLCPFQPASLQLVQRPFMNICALSGWTSCKTDHEQTVSGPLPSLQVQVGKWMKRWLYDWGQHWKKNVFKNPENISLYLLWIWKNCHQKQREIITAHSVAGLIISPDNEHKCRLTWASWRTIRKYNNGPWPLSALVLLCLRAQSHTTAARAACEVLSAGPEWTWNSRLAFLGANAVEDEGSAWRRYESLSGGADLWPQLSASRTRVSLCSGGCAGYSIRSVCPLSGAPIVTALLGWKKEGKGLLGDFVEADNM